MPAVAQTVAFVAHGSRPLPRNPRFDCFSLFIRGLEWLEGTKEIARGEKTPPRGDFSESAEGRREYTLKVIKTVVDEWGI